MEYQHPNVHALNLADSDRMLDEVDSASSEPLPFVRGAPKVGRNELCPCGSQKKYKQCHGKIA
jgi:preprotein translocase subunit SecA